MFAHCRDDAERWRVLYTVACLCDSTEDMDALCEQARAALGDAWPAGWLRPTLHDIFCRLPVDEVESSPRSAPEPRGYQRAPAGSPLHSWGTAQLVARGVSPAGPPGAGGR